MERKWEMGDRERQLIEQLETKGYTCELLKEYMTKTYYNLKKDGIEFKMEIPHLQINVDGYIKTIEKTYEIYKKYVSLPIIDILRLSMILTISLCFFTMILGLVYFANFGVDLGIVIDMLATLLCAISTTYIYVFDRLEFDEYDDEE